MLKPNKDVLRDKDVTLKTRRRNCGDGHSQPGLFLAPRYSFLAPIFQASGFNFAGLPYTLLYRMICNTLMVQLKKAFRSEFPGEDSDE